MASYHMNEADLKLKQINFYASLENRKYQVFRKAILWQMKTDNKDFQARVRYFCGLTRQFQTKMIALGTFLTLCNLDFK